MQKNKDAKVLGVLYSSINIHEVVEVIGEWATQRCQKFICFSNVHSCITANYDENFFSVLEKSQMVCPDGAPIAWMMRRMGFKEQRRVSGPDVFLEYCKHAEVSGESIFLYGSDENTMSLLKKKLINIFPSLNIAGSYSPPYRYINHLEDDSIINMINESGASTVWVSLGCPKQEVWMANHTDRINAVLLGVGAAFNFYAGTHQRAPLWMRKNGLEWLHRLCSDPLRLGKRYLVTNTIFILKAIKQLFFKRNKK